jgi:hypothetical protein
LNDRVLPFFEEHDTKLLRVLTDRGSEFCGKTPMQSFLDALPMTKEKDRSLINIRQQDPIAQQAPTVRSSLGSYSFRLRRNAPLAQKFEGQHDDCESK